MASRSDYDYSMWPEHVRPRRRHISLKLLACVFATGAVCAIAAAAVMSEFAPGSLSQASGRSWPLFAPAEDSRAAGTLAQPAPQEVAGNPAEPACDPQRSPYGINPCAAPAAETTGSASSAARPAKPAARAIPSRQVALPTIGTSQPPTEPAAAKTEPAKPGPAEQQAAATPKESEAASEEVKPAAQAEKPKPRKKARKRIEQPTGTAEVYQLPDGRRVTVIRRPDNSAYGYGYDRPTYQAYPGRPGYYQY